ncbi:MAG TPA: hypothetical protein VEE85_01195 [Candidatus Bathyarchaeia archaeon]|nr:hypothetical protein [Candidatus Bathyarchaeia archaeon]
MTFTIANTNSTVTLTGVSFTDTMPAGLTAISATPGCGGTVTVLPGSISLTGGTLLPDSACILTATVKGTTAGVWTNTTSVVTSIQGGNGAPATDSITVVAPPVISKAFATPTVLVGSSTGLTFTITNPNTTVALTGVGFSDNLPIGLVVSTPNGLTGSCGGGTITAAAGSKTISLSGATLAAEASCTFAVNVTGTTAGTDVNTTSAVTSSNGGNGNTASATVIVLAPALVNYFSNAHTAGAQDASVRITNPNTSGGNLCADIFVFDANEEMSECCSCTTTPDGLLTLSVNTDVTGNPLTGKSLSTGLIVIVPAAAIGGLCPLPTAMTPEPALRAWGTHIQTDSSGFVDTETESQNTGLSAANLTALKNQCAAIKTVGSGHGVCANSAALAGICNN